MAGFARGSQNPSVVASKHKKACKQWAREQSQRGNAAKQRAAAEKAAAPVPPPRSIRAEAERLQARADGDAQGEGAAP